MSATAAAQKLGIRREWELFAVWPEDGIVRYLPTYPSIHFGNYLNEAIQIVTSNKLFYRNGEMFTLTLNDLNWFRAETRTELENDEPFHCMAQTRLEVFLTSSMLISPQRFIEAYDDYALGLHPDLLSALTNEEFEISVIPNSILDRDEPSTKRSFDLYRLLNVWRKRMLSEQVSGFEIPDYQSSRLLFGVTGQKTTDGGVMLTSMFFGERFLESQKGWIVFFSVDLFEQQILTWIDAMTCETMTRHLDHCGLIIPHETKSFNSVRP